LLLLASYVVLLAAVAGELLLVHEPVALKGRFVLAVNVAFVAVGAAFELLGARFPVALWLSLSAVALLAGWLVDRSWILLHTDQERASATVAMSLARLLVKATVDGRFYRMEGVARSASIGIVTWPGGIVVLNFGGDWHQNKLRLARAYLSKQFRGVLPPVVIRLP
jgi:hypothetical protein